MYITFLIKKNLIMKTFTFYLLPFTFYLLLVSCNEFDIANSTHRDINESNSLDSKNVLAEFQINCAYNNSTWSIWETSGLCNESSIEQLEYKFNDLHCYLTIQDPLPCDEEIQDPKNSIVYQYTIVHGYGKVTTFNYDRSSILSSGYSGFRCVDGLEVLPVNYPPSSDCFLYSKCNGQYDCISNYEEMDDAQQMLADMAEHIFDEPTYGLDRETHRFHSTILFVNFNGSCFHHEALFVYRSCAAQPTPN